MTHLGCAYSLRRLVIYFILEKKLFTWNVTVKILIFMYTKLWGHQSVYYIQVVWWGTRNVLDKNYLHWNQTSTFKTFHVRSQYLFTTYETADIYRNMNTSALQCHIKQIFICLNNIQKLYTLYRNRRDWKCTVNEVGWENIYIIIKGEVSNINQIGYTLLQ